jgi:Ser/Thr protein kinase RdoA (MazF antagonist)
VSQPVTAVLTRPSPSVDVAGNVLRRHWGLDATLQPLPSERDRNFRVVDAGRTIGVLKLSNLSEEPAFLELQQLAMARLRAAGVPCQEPLAALDGSFVVDAGSGGGPPLARLLTWLPGEPLATVDAEARSPDLLSDLGRVMGRTATALAGITHPAARRAFQWDILRGETVIAAHAGAIAEGRRRALLERGRARLATTLWRAVAALRRGVIHNDANDHNVLVDAGARRVTGLLDFGDMVWSTTANEAAVAAAYALLGSEDPLDAVASVVAGFHDTCPLATDEARLIVELVIARLATSVALSAHQAQLDPADGYLRISESAAWTALERLLRVAPEDATDRMLGAMG